MQLFALLPWFATLIAIAGATTPESVEEAGRWLYLLFIYLFRIYSSSLTPVSCPKGQRSFISRPVEVKEVKREA